MLLGAKRHCCGSSGFGDLYPCRKFFVDVIHWSVFQLTLDSTWYFQVEHKNYYLRVKQNAPTTWEKRQCNLLIKLRGMVMEICRVVPLVYLALGNLQSNSRNCWKNCCLWITVNLHISGDIQEIQHALKQVCHFSKGLIEVSWRPPEEKIMFRDGIDFYSLWMENFRKLKFSKTLWKSKTKTWFYQTWWNFFAPSFLNYFSGFSVGSISDGGCLVMASTCQPEVAKFGTRAVTVAKFSSSALNSIHRKVSACYLSLFKNVKTAKEQSIWERESFMHATFF